MLNMTNMGSSSNNRSDRPARGIRNKEISTMASTVPANGDPRPVGRRSPGSGALADPPLEVDGLPGLLAA
jgi:hypothetical protein